MAKKKWEIKNLNCNLSLKESSKAILAQRLDELISAIKIFFESEKVENLHSVSIVLRRLRYSMELLVDCFDRKKFLNTYKKIEFLQDLSGVVRDIDVMKQNILAVSSEEKIKILRSVTAKFDERKIKKSEELKLELMKFSHSKSLKDFNKML